MTNLKANTYNGWANRETWLVNLYYGDSFDGVITDWMDCESLDLEQQKDEVIYDLSLMIKDYIEESLYDEIEGLSNFLRDFVNLDLIDWYELAETYYTDHVEDRHNEVLEDIEAEEEEAEEE